MQMLLLLEVAQASIAIALRMADKGKSIILLESGGMEFDAENQALYEGTNVGVPYFDLDVTRLRMLGGCTNHWGNQISTFEPIDFAKRDWVPHSGWPITRDDIWPYYSQATSFLDLGAFDYDQPQNWKDPKHNFDILPLVGGIVESKLFRRRSPPLRAGEFYKPTLERQSKIKAFLFANVTNIKLAPDGGSVSQLDVKTLTGKKMVVTGKQYVLACGGMRIRAYCFTAMTSLQRVSETRMTWSAGFSWIICASKAASWCRTTAFR